MVPATSKAFTLLPRTRATGTTGSGPVVTFAGNGDGDGGYRPDGPWQEQDRQHAYIAWGDIRDTFGGEGDIDRDGQPGRDHAKLYFGKVHHPVFTTRHTSSFVATCPPASADEYRSDDYRYFAAKWLVEASVIPREWNFGEADSTPMEFQAGGKYDMCRI